MTTLSGYTRLFFHLPVNNAAERDAAERVVDELNQRYRGATTSLLEAPVFRGYWQSDGEIIEDALALILVDVQDHAMDAPELAAQMEELRASAFQAYEEARASQLEIWLVAHPIFRAAG
jgi:hypothetical protein